MQRPSKPKMSNLILIFSFLLVELKSTYNRNFHRLFNSTIVELAFDGYSGFNKVHNSIQLPSANKRFLSCAINLYSMS